MLRFAGYVCLAFATGAIGTSWALHGFPVRLAGAVKVDAPAAAVEASFGDESGQRALRRRWEATQTNQGDNDREREQLRLNLLQAATGYRLSPCDKTMKANLVAALIAYTEAWQRKLDCFRPLNMTMFCGEKKLNDAYAAFSTPMDEMVKTAVQQATDLGGITGDDFPDAIRFDVAQFAGSGIYGGVPWACTASVPMKRLR